MKPIEMFLANLATIVFLIFAGFCIYFEKTGLSIASFVMASISVATFSTKNKD